MNRPKVVELSPYHQECNGCAYAGMNAYVPMFTYAWGWIFRRKGRPCREADCRSYPLYALMKGMKRKKEI